MKAWRTSSRGAWPRSRVPRSGIAVAPPGSSRVLSASRCNRNAEGAEGNGERTRRTTPGSAALSGHVSCICMLGASSTAKKGGRQEDGRRKAGELPFARASALPGWITARESACEFVGNCSPAAGPARVGRAPRVGAVPPIKRNPPPRDPGSGSGCSPPGGSLLQSSCRPLAVLPFSQLRKPGPGHGAGVATGMLAAESRSPRPLASHLRDLRVAVKTRCAGPPTMNPQPRTDLLGGARNGWWFRAA